MSVRSRKVAVLLAAYNGMEWIEAQLTSILHQSLVDVTVYISVDPSSDGTESWCAHYAKMHPEIVVLPEHGKFGSASRNFFRLIRDVDFDTYDFLAFADQDDLWHIDKLSRAIEAICEKKVDAYSSNVTAFWSDGRTHLLDKAQPQVAWDYLFEAAGPGCTYVMTNELATSMKHAVCQNWIKIQDVSLHDWYCYAFARSNGFTWYIDPRPSMDYRQHARNQVGANKGWKPLLARYSMINDGWWFGQIKILSQLFGRAASPITHDCLRLGCPQLIRLSFKAWQCRRRKRDKILFFIICWVGAFSVSKLK
ncbi:MULTISPECIES: glycosyltransferase [Pseudomonas]|uniref:Glycosyltransferase n=1 Tax=Pseudomonas rustica TaxID=2827099 RepID=A0ABS5MTB5_9PSED|nr:MULTISPECIES: glycosyltransferase [Pseudomonas]MBS4076862.1 glycosyltransferase [Pseudomonas rustica]